MNLPTLSPTRALEILHNPSHPHAQAALQTLAELDLTTLPQAERLALLAALDATLAQLHPHYAQLATQLAQLRTTAQHMAAYHRTQR